MINFRVFISEFTVFVFTQIKSEKALSAISTIRCSILCFPFVYYFIYLIILSIVLYSGTDGFIIFLF